MNDVKQKTLKLLNEVLSIKKIKAIGQTGDINIVPKAGETDIDIFVLCDNIPDYDERKAVYDRNSNLFDQCMMNVCEGGEWGTGDIFIIDGVDTMLMYFRIDDTNKYIDEVLTGKHLDSNHGFYPIGRCSTFVNLSIISDEAGIIDFIKKKLSVYPDDLKTKMIEFHINRTLDGESFGRSLLRKDVLYYHSVLERAIDHFLQALFAANKIYFPSRKRTKQYIDSFDKKPDNCYERLLEVIKSGSTPEGIEHSYNEWCRLINDLKCLC